MSLGFFQVPLAKNEPIYGYAPGSAEKAGLEVALKELKGKETEVPMYIGSELVFPEKGKGCRLLMIMHLHLDIFMLEMKCM
jgi:1-pyrroline-5-carboxylate dehydrogenase